MQDSQGAECGDKGRIEVRVVRLCKRVSHRQILCHPSFVRSSDHKAEMARGTEICSTPPACTVHPTYLVNSCDNARGAVMLLNIRKSRVPVHAALY
jgi:hypothetical protein